MTARINTSTTRQQRPPRPLMENDWLAVAVAVVVALVVTSFTIREPRMVDLRIVNPTAYDLEVDATGASRGGWTGVAIVEARSTASVERVVDQGSVWIFHLAGQGGDGGEVRRTRSQLVADRWTVRIPAVVGTRLLIDGAPPSPP